MTEKRWKRHEREIAELLGGKRVPINGRKGSDIAHSWIAPEVKSRMVVPKWLAHATQQAKAGATENHLPLCIIHKIGEPHARDLVVISLDDFVGWFLSEKIEADTRA